MDRKIHIYLASGWFTPRTEDILTLLEESLSTLNVEVYSPRRDGVKLSSDDFHSSELRKYVFEENVKHIDEADLVVANVDGEDGFLDTGTVWEIGYASATDVPIIGMDFTEDSKGVRLMGGATETFFKVCNSFADLKTYVRKFTTRTIHTFYQERYPDYQDKKHALLVTPNDPNCASDLSHVLTDRGYSVTALSTPSMTILTDSIGDYFKDADFFIADIDERNSTISWMMGQAYARHIPTISYTDFDYGVNIMLLVSIVRHCKDIYGEEGLESTLDEILKVGIMSLSETDTSNIKAS